MENVAPYYMVRPQTTLVAFASMPQKNSTESLDSRPSHGTCNNSGCIDERDKSSSSSCYSISAGMSISEIENRGGLFVVVHPSIQPTMNG